MMEIETPDLPPSSDWILAITSAAYMRMSFARQ